LLILFESYQDQYRTSTGAIQTELAENDTKDTIRMKYWLTSSYGDDNLLQVACLASFFPTWTRRTSYVP
jgi:hypothetical protein